MEKTTVSVAAMNGQSLKEIAVGYVVGIASCVGARVAGILVKKAIDKAKVVLAEKKANKVEPAQANA